MTEPAAITNEPDRERYLREGLLGEHPEAHHLLDSPPGESSGDEPSRARITFVRTGEGNTGGDREVRVPSGVTVFDAASWNGIAIDSTCGGHGTCRKCKVRVIGGSVPVSRLDPRAFSPDQLRQGWRLACLATAQHDLTVEVPPLLTRPKAATVGVGRQVILRPAVQKRYVELDEPTLADQRTDVQRLLAAIDDLEPRPELYAVRRLPKVLRENDFKVTAVIVDEVLIDVEPGDTTATRYGIAFDLGTTTVVATLLDLSTGTPAAVRSMLNKQQPFGGDVISRISATMLDPDALGRLQQAARDTLAELAAEVCAEAGVAPSGVYEVALAGNATMAHLVLGIDPEPLGVAPFVMSSAMSGRDFPELLAADLGLTAEQVHPRARAYLFPSLGAYVGGDIVAGMLASGMDRDKRLRLFIDVGTNCEIVLGDSTRLLSTAAPAGPAFEGASIRCGMRAADGAIEVVKLSPDGVALQVIGDVEPVGLCGSGLVDAVAELVAVGLLDSSGRLLTAEGTRAVIPGLADRLVELDGGERVFVLHWSGEVGDVEHAIYLSQRDVRELQFAKAAIATGWNLLLTEYGASVADVQQVLLAGSFGSYLSAANAVRIGLVPKVPVVRIVSAGNVAGEGAKMALLSIREREGARRLLDEVRYVELSDRPDFNDLFVDQLAFPH
ncbi:MAG: ASKHA domain-containing protein [Kineosporiaceae bacterium]